MRCLVAFFLLAGVLAAQATKPEAKATISGVVRDTTGAPVPEISVGANLNVDPRTLMMTDRAIRVTGLPTTAVTDESGSYSINVPAPASVFRKDGARPDSQNCPCRRRPGSHA